MGKQQIDTPALNDNVVLSKMAKLGKEMYAYRKKLHGMTIKELSARSGVSERTIYYLESLPDRIEELGEVDKVVKVKLDNLIRLSIALGMDIKLVIR